MLETERESLILFFPNKRTQWDAYRGLESRQSVTHSLYASGVMLLPPFPRGDTFWRMQYADYDGHFYVILGVENLYPAHPRMNFDNLVGYAFDKRDPLTVRRAIENGWQPASRHAEIIVMSPSARRQTPEKAAHA